MEKLIRRKLIEVGLPLDAINEAGAREKSVRRGHPSTLHLWWARRPLAIARAVIFAQMVDDPSEHVEVLLKDPTKRLAARHELAKRLDIWKGNKANSKEARREDEQLAPARGAKPTLEECIVDIERERLFELIRRLVLWENSGDDELLRQAQIEIQRSWATTCAENALHPRAEDLFNPSILPALHDPFAGGGSIPLEAQRLGIHAYAGDLNPVAVLINKAMLEIPTTFVSQMPVSRQSHSNRVNGSRHLFETESRFAIGLAEDVRYYGKLIRDEAEKRIGNLYPTIEVTTSLIKERPDLKDFLGHSLTVIAWVWARTVRSPNARYADIAVPLASTFLLSSKTSREAYIEPIIEANGYHFAVKAGKPKTLDSIRKGTKSKIGGFSCLMSGEPISLDYIRSEGVAGRLGCRMMAAVAESSKGRVYLSPTKEMEALAQSVEPTWKPDIEFFQQALGFRVGGYGFTKWSDLFTNRQLVALTTLTDLVQESRERIRLDAIVSGMNDDGKSLADGGSGALAYADAVCIYLAFSVSRLTMRCSSQAAWDSSYQKIQNAFGRHAIPMIWDFCEGNPFCSATGSYESTYDAIAEVVSCLGSFANIGVARQEEASIQTTSLNKVVSTDPPYFDNIGYADLSDYFFVWLRRMLGNTLPDLFKDVAVPKAMELVATPSRHGGKAGAEAFFLNNMSLAMKRLAEQVHPAFPITIYYAFKQAARQNEVGTFSSGWEAFLEALLGAGFAITGTWPVRTEMKGRVRDRGQSNALASSIVLVCRPRPHSAPSTTQKQFVSEMKDELQSAIVSLQRSSIAPVDLSQAVIGPGMAIFSRYARVVKENGASISVREALSLINEILDEVLTNQGNCLDDESRWAIAWFEQNGFSEGGPIVAEEGCKASNTSIRRLRDMGIISVTTDTIKLNRLHQPCIERDSIARSKRPCVWIDTHHLIRVLESNADQARAVSEAVQLGANLDAIREVAYRLYVVCERRRWAPEAALYNGLIQKWPEIVDIVNEMCSGVGKPNSQGGKIDQPSLFDKI